MHSHNVPDPFDGDPATEMNAPSQPAWGRSILRTLFEMLETIAPAFVIALLINLFLAQGTYVHGHSMEPSLHSAQRLLVEKVSYRFRAPSRGDIVVVDVEGFEVPLIKRVIGLPGETVEIRENRVYINGLLLEEPYLSDVRQQNYGPVHISPLHVFVMGDNRQASNDSRYFGAVHIDGIVGRAWVSYWPLEEIGLIQ